MRSQTTLARAAVGLIARKSLKNAAARGAPCVHKLLSFHEDFFRRNGLEGRAFDAV